MRRLTVLVLVTAAILVLAPAAPAAADGNEAPGAPEAFRSLSAGWQHVCALRYDGAVRCWGDNGSGALGLGDQNDRGDAPGEMGDALPTVDLGTGRTATAISAGTGYTCALLDTGQVKCWGDGDGGALGLGDEADRGDGPGEMGDALPTVALGTGRTATAISAADAHTCALLDTGQVKCWGVNWAGHLGLGDTADRGDGPGEMGNALPTVPLGSGRSATAISAVGDSTCVILDTAQVKCWGDNETGQLGLGDTANRGDGPGEMGDALPAVPLGTGRTATAVNAGYSPCALLDTGQVKCWGDNGKGQLGLGDTATRGDGSGEMGDALPAVALGTGRTATAISVSGNQACALLDTGQVKCWGDGQSGGLGVGDTSHRGDGSGEMGDALPAVALGTNRTAVAVSTGTTFTCTLLDDDTTKCWGADFAGQLGQGDSEHRGDQAGEMGDALTRIDLPPPNDNFAQAQLLAGPAGTAPGSNASTGKEVGEPDHAGFAAANSSVWFQWTAPADGVSTIDTFGSGFDTVLAVYTGTALNTLTPVASNDDTDTVQSRVDVTTTAQTTYRIAVAGFDGHSGRIQLHWTQTPANDDFAHAAELTGPNGSVLGSNEVAGLEPGEPDHNPSPSAGDRAAASVWYRWTAPAEGRTSFDTSGSSFDTVLAVYTGTAVDALTVAAANDDIQPGSLQSRAAFTAHAGTTYRIAVAGYDSDQTGTSFGTITLHWRQAAPCDGRAVTRDLSMGDTPTAGADVIRGTGGNDTINGGGGADRICGGNGADTLTGGAGTTVDRLFGENGADTLRGGNGNDALFGGAQNDALFGEAGNDALNGGSQRDTCNGGPQQDTATTCEVRTNIP